MGRPIRLGINGFGRIGRCVCRAALDRCDIEVVAVNDLAGSKSNQYLLQYDSIHGPLGKKVVVENNDLLVDGKRIRCYSEREPEKLWSKMHKDGVDVDVMLECSGHFCSKCEAEKHIHAGAKKVLISAPAGKDVVTIVYGVNHAFLTENDIIVSNASCTTNCLAPVAKALNDVLGIKEGLMLTVHSVTNDQVLVDRQHGDLRRARAATCSMIPTKTGAAAAVGLVIPELSGKLDGFAIRVPTLNVSVVDLTFEAGRDTSVDEVNAIMKKASESPSMKGILGYNEDCLVSCDFNHTSYSSVFDSTQTRVIGGKLVKVLSWYDNEWGFSNRMLDTAKEMADKN